MKQLAALLLCFASATAEADSFLQAGRANGSQRLTVGVAQDTDKTILGLRLHNELSLSHWSNDGRKSWQVSLVPMLRYGRKAYIEAGVGISYFDHPSFAGLSTNWQFADHLGVGYGPVGLRLSHFSNAGLRKPNPGVNAVQLTYTSRF